LFVGNKHKKDIATNMELKIKDWLIISSFILITIIPLIIGLSDWGEKTIL